MFVALLQGTTPDTGTDRSAPPSLIVSYRNVVKPKAGTVILPQRSSSPNISPNPSRILVIDRHPAIGDAISSILKKLPDIIYCGQATTASEGFERVYQSKPDIVILDLSLEDAYGLDLTSQLISQVPNVRILIFSQYDEQIFAERAVEAGAMGYIMKRVSTDVVIESIRSILRNETYLSPAITVRLLNKITKGYAQAHILDQLSHRELSVLMMLSEGSSPQEMADRLSLDRKTVETHRRRVKEKLGFDNVSSLLHYATQWRHTQGTLSPEDFFSESVAESEMHMAS